MGLADQLFAGLGQGLASGVQNYNQGLEQQRQDARQVEADQRLREQWAQQQMEHGQKMAATKLQGLQTAALGMQARGDVAGMVGLLPQATAAFNQAYGTDIKAPNLVGGLREMPDTPDGKPLMAPLGPGVAGPYLPTPMKKVQDFNNPQSLAATQAGLFLPKPKHEIKAYGDDQTLYDVDESGNIVFKGRTPHAQRPITLGANQAYYDPTTGLQLHGPARTFAPQKQGRHVVNGVLVDDATGDVINGTPRTTPDPNAIQSWEKDKAEATARARYRYEQTHKMKDNRGNWHSPDAAEVDAEEQRAGVAYERDHPRPGGGLPVPPVDYNDTGAFDRVERVAQQVEKMGFGTVTSRARSDARDAVAKRENGVPAGRNNHGNRNILDFVPAPGMRAAAEEFFKQRGGVPEWHGTHLHVTFPQVQSAIPMSDALAAFYDKHNIIQGAANA